MVLAAVQAFVNCLRELHAQGLGPQAAPQDVPVHGMGHSNGALLHLLIGSTQDVPNRSNILISFNNK